MSAPITTAAPITPALATRGTPAVTLSHISHRFGLFLALDDVSLEVWPGEFVTLLGQSGSGKSTLLRIIAGLTAPSSGRVAIDGTDMVNVPTQRRGVGFVFQNYALFPHLTVFENVAYPLRIRGVRKAEITHRVEAVLARVNLPGLGGRYASQLSGGQQQRVAVARALVYEPAVLLMDEPLGALDRKLRRHMQLELRQLQQDLGITCLYVTHDQEEALTMSDRIAVMRNGRIHQCDDPVTIYRHPISSFVADFVGSTNMFRCRVARVEADGTLRLATEGGSEIPALAFPGAAPGMACEVAVRPEYVRIGHAASCPISFTAIVEKIVFVGNVADLTCRLPGNETLEVELAGTKTSQYAPGDHVFVGWDFSDMGVFPATTGSGTGT